MPEWRDVIGFEGFYRVSDKGEVFSVSRIVPDKGSQRKTKEKMLRPNVLVGGYHQVSLHKHGKRYVRKVHTLVAEAFIGPRPKGMEIAHNDGNASNCALSNIRYATPKENAKDKIKHGTRPHGEMMGNAKLTWDLVNKARAMREQGASMAEIMTAFGNPCSKNRMYEIFRNKAWVRK